MDIGGGSGYERSEWIWEEGVDMGWGVEMGGMSGYGRREWIWEE